MPTSPKIKPKRYHGFSVLLFILGTLFPPLAVAARFGIGSDFWLNLFLTLAGYIPGHVHNFYIQNIRNNKTHRRTPKWAQRYGLVDTTTIKRKERRSQWAKRYDERLPTSTLEDRPVEDGQNPDASTVSLSAESAGRRAGNGELWNAEEEQYYSQNNGNNGTRSSRWQYPANFDDTTSSPVLESSTPKKKKKVKKDRFARTEDAYSLPEDTTRRKKKKRANRSTVGDEESTNSRGSGSTAQVPEDAEGGHYGDRAGRAGAQDEGEGGARVDGETTFDHQF
ncbi:hypothetical protein BJV78DRAFT_1117108 [Lactifluus subvellereus]|nr:hypothetical protein BJV78DRAFT_1117108 [Lactifluus subvellereus]